MQKKTESKNPKIVKTKNGRVMLLLKCAVCDSEKLTFIKEQEPSGLLSSLGINTSLSKIRLVGLFCFNSIKQVNTRYKINERVNTFSLAGDKSIPEMHLKQPEFTYSAKNTKI